MPGPQSEVGFLGVGKSRNDAVSSALQRATSTPRAECGISPFRVPVEPHRRRSTRLEQQIGRAPSDHVDNAWRN